MASYNEVDKFLYIGDKVFAKDKTALKDLGIQFIVNCTPRKNEGGVHNFFENDSNFNYMRIPVIDSDNSDLSAYFDEAMAFIEKGVQTHFGVLVHCQQGVSRSSTIMIAYLMKHKKMTLQEAYMHLKKRRPVCKPKKNFLRQLMKYEKRLRSEDISEEKTYSLKASSNAKKRPIADISPSPSPSPSPEKNSCEAASSSAASASAPSDGDQRSESSSGDADDAAPSPKKRATKKRVKGPSLPPDLDAAHSNGEPLSKNSRPEKDSDEPMSDDPAVSSSEPASKSKSDGADSTPSKSALASNSDESGATPSVAAPVRKESTPKRKVYGVSLPPDM